MTWWRKASRRQRVGVALLASGLAVLIQAQIWGATRALDGIFDGINLLAGVAQLVGIALACLGRARTEFDDSSWALAETADRLMRQACARETQERAQLLNVGRTTTAVANLHYRLVDGPPEPRAAGAGAEEQLHGAEEQLHGVARFYAARGGRLVILGGAGSGKSVLALELLVQLLERRRAVADPHQRAMLPVPVRISLPTWNPALTMPEWIADDLATRYGLSEQQSRALVENRKVLPVLDGLDEMDPPGSAPDRAVAAIAAVNAYLDCCAAAPVVITCRTEHYRRLIRTTGSAVHSATAIVIQPLTLEQIREYLDQEYSSPADAAHRRQWDPLLRPDSGEARQAIANLKHPWRLALAITYHRGGGDLGALLSTPEELAGGGQYVARTKSLLLSAFIPARVAIKGAGRYPPGAVVEWCRNIAKRVPDRVDIVLHEWWTVAGVVSVRRRHAVTAAASAFLLGAVAGTVGLGLLDPIDVWTPSNRGREHIHPGANLMGGLNLAWLLIIVLGVPLVAMWRGYRYDSTRLLRISVRQLNTRRGQLQLLRWLTCGIALGLAPGLVFGFVVGTTFGYEGGLGNAVAFGITGGLLFGLTRGLRPVGEVTVDPRDPLRDDLLLWVALGLAIGPGYGIPLALAPGLGYGFLGGCVLGLIGGMISGLALGLSGHAWMRYSIVAATLARQRELPLRFMGFLHWAHSAGILRVVGNAYQFRHVELHSWLAGAGQPAVCGPSRRPDPPAGRAAVGRRRDADPTSCPHEVARFDRR